MTRSHQHVFLRLLPIAILSLIYLGLPGVSFAAASGTITMTIDTDETGKITSVQGTTVLVDDDTTWWDIIQWVGDYAQIEAYLDGQRVTGVLTFIFTRGTNARSDLGKEKTFSWWPWGLEPGEHTVTYVMRDVMSGEPYLSGGSRRELGNIITEYSVHVIVEGNGDQFLRPIEERNLGFSKLQRTHMRSDPVNVGTGNAYEQQTDFRIPAVGASLTFTRVYNSRSSYQGPLGAGWTHTYNVRLQRHDDYHLTISRADGGASGFIKNPEDLYQDLLSNISYVEELTSGEEITGWVWHRPDGSTHTFDAVGRLQRITKFTNETTLTYDPTDRLEQVTDVGSGRTLEFRYNTENLITEIVGPATAAVSAGVWVTYQYDSNQNLTSVTYADGSGISYSYTDPGDTHNLTEKKDQMGHVLATWSYDSQDRVINCFTRQGQGVSISYLSHNIAAVTDAYGKSRTYHFDTRDGRQLLAHIEGTPHCPDCVSDLVRAEYDSENRIIEEEYANGLIIQYDDFDQRGNARMVRRAVDTGLEKTLTSTFHPEMDVKLSQSESSVLGAGLKLTIWDYDVDGNDTPNENPTRLLYRKIDRGYTAGPSGNVIPYEYITTYTYNDKGQVTAIDGPQPGNGDTTSFTYDPTTGDLLAVTRPVVGTTTYSDYDAAGQVGRVTDPNGNSTTYSYDGRGRITAITSEADGTTTWYAYNGAGEFGSVTAPNGVVYTFSYDTTYGRLNQVKEPLGNYIDYSYDEQGNRTEVSYFDQSHTRYSWRRNSYQGPTAPGKLWRVINPDDTFTEYTYDTGGNIASVTDPAGRTTTYTYDVVNRLTTVTQPGDVITRYAYDSQDNLISVTDAENHATSYIYDDTGRLISTTSSDTNTTSYTYDPAGNLATKTDANGTTVTYTYDVLNRLVAIQPPDSEQAITFRYDEGTNGKGHLTGRSDRSGTYQYSYAATGNLIKEEKSIDGVTFVTAYTYDPAGILTGITYPSGRTVTYGLDTAGRISKVTTAKDGTTHTLAQNIAALPFGPITQLTYGSGTTLTRSFDELYRITSISSGSVQNLSYIREAAGNITAITDNLNPSKTQSFAYDDLYRLVGATGPYGKIAYTYDAVGNRLSKTTDGQTDTYTYEQGTNRLRAIEGARAKIFTYDPNGNTLSENERAYSYNQHNRLMSISQNGSSLTEYAYNGEGQRVKKSTQDETRLFHYDLSGHLIAETDDEGDIVAEYAYLGDQPLAMIGEREVRNVQQEQGAASCFVSQASWAAPLQQESSMQEAIYYFLTDHLGTPQVMTDDTGTVVWRASYKPFGQAEVDSNSTVVNNLRFPGQYFDEEIGLHYNYFRYYHPQFGRYVEPDPLKEFLILSRHSNPKQPLKSVGRFGLYGYVLNNPINLVDPLALCEVSPRPKRKTCFELFWEEFEKNRVPGANLFGIPTGAVSGLIGAFSMAGPPLGERLSQQIATGAFESQRLTRHGFYVKNYFPRFFTVANASRLLGRASWVVTAFYVPADITTLIYTWVTLECDE
jgi:RHS repeat-associated protein